MIIIRYKNSLAYIQRQINRLLREYREYARAYIDDIIIFLIILENYIRYLRAIFKLFIKYNIIINLKKTFIDYFFVKLLN